MLREIPTAITLKKSEEDNEDSRTVQLSFSSEEPYSQLYVGNEILDHSEGCVDLTRLNEIGVVLFNHDRDQVIGRIDKAWVEDGRGLADITFDEDEESEKIFQKVKSGTLKGVSVGYVVDRYEVVEEGAKSEDGRFEGPVSIAKSWTPLEVSVVSIPADAGVGVNRDFDEEEPDIPSAEAYARQIDVNNNLLSIFLEKGEE